MKTYNNWGWVKPTQHKNNMADIFSEAIDDTPRAAKQLKQLCQWVDQLVENYNSKQTECDK